MPNPDLIPVPFAQDGQKNSIPLERAIADPSYRAAWTDGFPPDTRIPEEVGGEAPDGLDFNGLFNALSQAVVFLQKGNAYQFDASMAPYPIGALVRSNDNLTTYQSTIAANSNNPNTNMTGWRVYNSSSFVVDNLTTNDTGKALSANMGKSIADSFNSTRAVTGKQPFLGGLSIQWFTVNIPPIPAPIGSVITASFNFPEPFENGVFAVLTTNNTTSGAEGNECSVSVVSKNKSSISLQVLRLLGSNSTGTETFSVQVLVIGD